MKTPTTSSDSTAMKKSDNELIATFMGLPYGKNTDKNGMLPYDTSWDWLMPAWIKFRDLDTKQFNERANAEMFDSWILSLQWYLFSSSEPSRFHERLATAIKWYNQNKVQP